MLGLALWLVSCTGTETPIDDLGNIPEESIPSGTGNMFSLAMRIPLPNDYMSTKAYEGVDRGSISEILIDGDLTAAAAVADAFAFCFFCCRF